MGLFPSFQALHCPCVCVCVVLCLHTLVRKHLGQMCVVVSRQGWVGVNTNVCVSWYADGHWGGTGTVSHGLSHRFECIYLFSSMDVLGCVRLHRGEL